MEHLIILEGVIPPAPPLPEDALFCAKCNRPREMHLQIASRTNSTKPGLEMMPEIELYICAELLPQFELKRIK